MKARPIETTLARFHQSYIPVTESGCWLWMKHTNQFGYGYFNVGRKHYRAHRWIYEQLHGPIHKNLQCDHLCRVKSCVNPDHIRIVTNRINTLAGDTVPARNLKKTHCPQGHPYSPENTGHLKRGERICLTCNRIQNRQWRAEVRNGRTDRNS